MAVVLETIGTAGKALQAMAVAEGVIRLTGLDKEREPREESDMSEEQPQETRTIVDEIEVEGRELVARVQELIREGNVRKVRVKDSKGRYLIEIPLAVYKSHIIPDLKEQYIGLLIYESRAVLFLVIA
jgi:hypothetical protein